MRRLLAALPAVVALVAATTAAASPSIVDFRTGGRPCGATLHANADRLAVRVADADPQLTVDFALWPDGDPSDRTERPGQPVSPIGGAWTSMPGAFTHGRTYSWHARVSGAEWSPPCRFTVDTVPPRHPSVTSPNYPPAADGPSPADQPGTFVFDGGGDPDVAGFQYGFEEDAPGAACEVAAWDELVCADPLSGPGTVRATRGRAEVQVQAPGGFSRLFVRSVDAGGLRSDAVVYEFTTT